MHFFLALQPSYAAARVLASIPQALLWLARHQSPASDERGAMDGRAGVTSFLPSEDLGTPP